ncbi:MAG: NADH-quinone oxidoreductase subunit NuoK [Sulfurimonas sp.]|jgi:NADH-quinone oxidoreductase subunit K|nr:NADH-quinone oxidoreductase subunit NuoK [Sulfurimonas sp.]MBU1216882.1 NADH-quinone oxidoreductase subunit NuoK [bacterium]MBU1435009.1 NADH-quinone oxidoreductase subunit NuoK [bacterium]MBU1504114.1 NADH-quinone oxidoreductase subunit NuoK [bacterium]MBU3939960.1 NADH-quinone oxidoreductase subunit NuoK [bacterium]
MTPNMFFLLTSLLFSIGLVGLVSRRNLFVVYMSVELMLSSINLLLATLSKILGDASGSVIALLMIAVIAAEAALFLAMIIHLYRAKKSVDSDSFTALKGVKVHD